ncbi:unnamed protein product [Cyclocybe aegerita]|uniref:Uncharacterized protein n=1 Tax=Cyclocybe aegerita TaxID=1973307 RepID=A0A8S0W7U1_CYCAE|nr:unnamed protein product [Cyclocybe aegerita]
MLSVDEAVSFLDEIKLQFQRDPGKYDRFLDIMRDFRGNVISTHEVLVRISALFNGYPELVRGFNQFLPAGYKLEPSTDSSGRSAVLLNTPQGVTMYPRDYARRDY